MQERRDSRRERPREGRLGPLLLLLLLDARSTAGELLEEPFEPPADRCATRSVVNEEGLVELFALSERRSLVHARQLEGGAEWTGWEDLGGLFAGGPAAATNDQGQIEVFARGVDRRIYSRKSVGTCGSAWTPERWECLGGCFTAGPSVVRSSEGLLNLFARGCDRSVRPLPPPPP